MNKKLKYSSSYLSPNQTSIDEFTVNRVPTQSLVAQMVKNQFAVKETQDWSLDWEDPLEKGMATHFSILSWESHGERSLAGYSPWGHKESDTTEWLLLLNYHQWYGTTLLIFSHMMYIFLWFMVYMYHSFLIHSSADGHLGCFHVLAIINSAVMNTGVHVSLSDLVSLGLVHWEDPEGSGRQGGGRGIGMGNTCKSMANSCQCMTRPTTICKVISLQLIKINEKKKQNKTTISSSANSDICTWLLEKP